jgi:hypothetical protein
MLKRTIILFIFFILAVPAVTKAQDSLDLNNENVVYRVIIDEDTMLVSSIEEVIIFRKPRFRTRREWRRYYRLIRNIKKVYPIAKAASAKYDSISTQMMAINSQKDRKKYLKQVEQGIMDEYEDDIRHLTITQGKILLKLIDREIGETSYDLLKELKGSFTAFFWQAIARIFGQNLKVEFDADGEDWLINEIMILLENGQL